MNVNNEALIDVKNKIKALENDLSGNERIGKIKELYSSSIEAAFESRDTDFICKYITFLDDHNNSKAAYEVAERLNRLQLDCPSDFGTQDIADLSLSLAVVCENLSEFKRAQDCFSKALMLYEKCGENESEELKAKTAQCYLKFGLFYIYQHSYSNASLYLTRAVEAFEELAAKNPSEYNIRLSESLNGLCQFYAAIRNLSKAELFLKRAESINKALLDNEESLACSVETLLNFGKVYSSGDWHIKEDKQLFEAKEICEKLAELDGEKYKPFLAKIYFHIGLDYNGKREYDLAKDCFTRSIEILKPFADSAKERYSYFLTFVYTELADYYLTCDDKETAEKYFNMAVEAAEPFVDNQFPKYNAALGTGYLNFGASCLMKKERKLAERYLKKAADIFESLAKMYPEQFVPVLASCYINYALAVAGINLLKKIKYLNKSVALAKTYPEDPVCKVILEQYDAK